jgi:hypothetical protein
MEAVTVDLLSEEISEVAMVELLSEDLLSAVATVMPLLSLDPHTEVTTEEHLSEVATVEHLLEVATAALPLEEVSEAAMVNITKV